MVISAVCVLVFAGSLNCRIYAKSRDLLAIANTLGQNKRLLTDIYLDMYRLYVDYGGGKISVSDMKSDIVLKTTEVDNCLDYLEELLDKIMPKHLAAMPNEMFAWDLAGSCVMQMCNACFSLKITSQKMQEMGVSPRFSEEWKRQYDMASLNLNLASVRLDLTGLMWSLLMAQP